MTRFLLALLFIFGMNAAYAESLTAKSSSNLTPPITGDMFKLTTFAEPIQLPQIMLSSADKGLVYLNEYSTKLIVLNVWATWCPPCVKEMPSLNALQHAMGGNLFDVVTVSLDTGGPDVVKKYLTDNKLDALPGFIDTNGDIQKLEVFRNVPGVPVSLIIDPQQRIIGKVEGDVDWNGPAARAVLEYYARKVRYSSI